MRRRKLPTIVVILLTMLLLLSLVIGIVVMTTSHQEYHPYYYEGVTAGSAGMIAPATEKQVYLDRLRQRQGRDKNVHQKTKGSMTTTAAQRTVLVVGANNFLGKAVVQALLERGDKVVAVMTGNDNGPTLLADNSTVPDNAILVVQQGVSYKALYTAFLTHMPHSVLHLGIFQDDNDNDNDNNNRVGQKQQQQQQSSLSFIPKTLTNVLELCRAFTVDSMVIASSRNALSYGPDQDKFKSLETQLEMLGYGHAHRYGMNAAALRFSTVYGPNAPNRQPLQVLQALESGKPLPDHHHDKEPGSEYYDFLYIDDAVSGIVHVMDRLSTILPTQQQQYVVWGVYPMASGTVTSWRGLVDAACEITGKTPINELTKPVLGSKAPPRLNVGITEKAFRFQAKVPLMEGMRRVRKEESIGVVPPNVPTDN